MYIKKLLLFGLVCAGNGFAMDADRLSVERVQEIVNRMKWDTEESKPTVSRLFVSILERDDSVYPVTLIRKVVLKHRRNQWGDGCIEQEEDLDLSPKEAVSMVLSGRLPLSDGSTEFLKKCFGNASEKAVKPVALVQDAFKKFTSLRMMTTYDTCRISADQVVALLHMDLDRKLADDVIVKMGEVECDGRRVWAKCKRDLLDKCAWRQTHEQWLPDTVHKYPEFQLNRKLFQDFVTYGGLR